MKQWESGETDGKVFSTSDIRSQSGGGTTSYPVEFEGNSFVPKKGYWKTHETGATRLLKANRLTRSASTLRYVRYFDDNPTFSYTNFWGDTGTGSFTDEKIYIVQTGIKAVERCILMATDPGDLVLDPTCGSGTTATVAEQWGRRWITIDTSRVALALARTRLMAARYPWYLLADSEEGKAKEADLTLRPPSDAAVHHDIRQGFVYKRVPHITLKSIANNARIDDIWERWQGELEALRQELNHLSGRRYADDAAGYTREETQIAPEPADVGNPPFEEWTMPREPGAPWPEEAIKPWENSQKNTKRATREKHLATLNQILSRDYNRAKRAVDKVSDCQKVSVINMHLAKGLEFRAVVVMACDQGILPLDDRIADAADEAELDDIYETERRLLYVSCTRARDRLLVTGVEPASEYIADLGVN